MSAGPLPVWAGLLTAQGKCLFDFIVWGDGDDLLLDCEADAADDLDQAAVDVSAAAADQRSSATRAWRCIGRREGERAIRGWRRLAGAGSARPASRRAAGSSIGCASGCARARAELGDLLWLECNAAELNGVSFTKGCFVGQENTARMNWRAKVNRRLVVVEGDGGERARVAYPELGLAVVHARVEAIPANAIVPDWLAAPTGLE